MRLFVLAAGKGSRLSAASKGMPKCLVDLGDGSTLLGRLAAAACAAGSIDELVIVTGYEAERVDQMLDSISAGLRTRVLYNPFYEIAGPLVSLWVAHPWMDGADFLVCNGDTYYTARALELVAGHKPLSITLGVDTTGRGGSDSLRVELDANRRLRHVAKDVPKESASGVSAGLLAVRGIQMRRELAAAICRMIRNRESIQPKSVWHSMVNHLVAQGTAVDTVELAPRDWHEIDTLEDLQEMQKLMLTVDGSREPCESH